MVHQPQHREGVCGTDDGYDGDNEELSDDGDMVKTRDGGEVKEQLLIACKNGDIALFDSLVCNGALIDKDQVFITELSLIAIGEGHVDLWSNLVQNHEAVF